MLKFIKNFSVQKCIDFETVIYDSPTENLDENYRLFYCVLQDWDVIDFENTAFTSGGIGTLHYLEFNGLFFADKPIWA